MTNRTALRPAFGGNRTGPLDDLSLGKTDLANTNPHGVQDGPITVVLEGCPRGKERPRFGKGHAYTAPATREFAYDFGWRAKAAMAGRRPLKDAIRIVALFELPIPISWSKRRRADAIARLIRPTGKPDLDNLLKLAIDAINGICVDDDAQIVEISAKKVFGVNPKTVVTIFPYRTEHTPPVFVPDSIGRFKQKKAESHE